jgi:hypothetical protein
LLLQLAGQQIELLYLHSRHLRDRVLRRRGSTTRVARGAASSLGRLLARLLRRPLGRARERL